MLRLPVFAFIFFLLCACQQETTTEILLDKRLSGGDTTVFDQSSNAFSLPAANTSITRRDNFFIGNAFFRQPWVSAPASTSSRDGLGPLFNTNSCQGCHIKDGRGHPPINDEEHFISALVRISIPASNSDEHKTQLKTSGVVADPVYGGQIQPRAIMGVKAEAQPQLSYTEIKGAFPDGEQYSLIKPVLELSDPAYGTFHPQLQTSVRVAQPMIGLGLLEAINEQDLLALADPADANGDGISGRSNQVWDRARQQTVMGRFGWKASQPNVAQQSLTAFAHDVGIRSTLVNDNVCTASQSDCLQAPHGGEPEISDEIANKVIFYAKLLAVPARRDVDNPEVMLGESLFQKINCSGCHTIAFTTGSMPGFPELENQSIQPFTDLLLHDMGEGLADNRTDFLANGNEWRTPPLWGIGLTKVVNEHTRFLHDGRARNVQEAILWHGGEAQASRNAYMSLTIHERQALLTFLDSL